MTARTKEEAAGQMKVTTMRRSWVEAPATGVGLRVSFWISSGESNGGAEEGGGFPSDTFVDDMESDSV